MILSKMFFPKHQNKVCIIINPQTLTTYVLTLSNHTFWKIFQALEEIIDGVSSCM